MVDLPKSRKEARDAGVRFFFTGVPCRRGHVTKRYVAGGACVTCTIEKATARQTRDHEAYKASQRDRYVKDSEAYKQRTRQRRILEPEKVRAEKRAEYEKHRAAYIARAAEWLRTHPVERNHYSAINRAARIARRPRWLSEEHKRTIQALYAEAQRLSLIRGEPYHVDHIVPLCGKTVSGLHVPWNLQVLPGRENLVKSNRFE